jgi:hypothetical protein
MGKASYKIETRTRVGASPQYQWVYTNASGYQWMGPKLGTPELAREDFRDWWESKVTGSKKSKLPPEIV